MPYSPEQIQELDILIRYNLESSQQGIKVHGNAHSDTIDAVKRLHEKGMITQIDGGYLTDMGRTAAEHAQTLLLMLAPITEAS